MLFTPKKRGRDWYWFNMVGLYGFSVAFGIGAIGVLLSSNNDLSGRIMTAFLFSLAALTAWTLGRRCSTMVAQLSGDDRPR